MCELLYVRNCWLGVVLLVRNNYDVGAIVATWHKAFITDLILPCLALKEVGRQQHLSKVSGGQMMLEHSGSSKPQRDRHTRSCWLSRSLMSFVKSMSKREHLWAEPRWSSTSSCHWDM